MTLITIASTNIGFNSLKSVRVTDAGDVQLPAPSRPIDASRPTGGRTPSAITLHNLEKQHGRPCRSHRLAAPGSRGLLQGIWGDAGAAV